MFYWICWLIAVPILLIIFPLRIIGKKYLKLTKKQATIFCANHQTNNDAIIYKARIAPTAKIMAKKSLFKNKLGGAILKKFGAYPVDRGANDITAVKTTIKILKANKKLLLFPEGTRIKNAESMDIKNGLVLFALKSDAWVVPSYFKKVTNAFVFNTLLIDKPFKFSQLDEFKDKKIDKELLDKASSYLQERFLRLKNIPIKAFKIEFKAYKNELKQIKKANKKKKR